MMALSKLVLFLVHRGAVLDLCKGFNVAEPRNYLDGHALISTYKRSQHDLCCQNFDEKMLV